MKKFCNVCVWGDHFLLTTFLKPPLLLANLSWNQNYFEGWLPGWFGKRHMDTAVWLWTSACPQEDISWLLIHAGDWTIQAKPSAGTCQSGKWQLDLSHPWDTTPVLETQRVRSVPPLQPFPGGHLLLSEGKDVLSLASLAFIPIYPWHVVEGTLRKLVNNQRKMSQAFASPFPLLITLFLMNCIFLTYHFLCSCPLQSYSQF